MLYIEPQSMEAAFHFAAEEYVMKAFDWKEPVMMIWQTDNCAMLGVNQIAEAEIDMSLAEKEGVQVVRRSSGGGTLFTDPGNLLLTMITPYEEGENPRKAAQEKLAEPMVEALNKMGIPARTEGRNDILVDGKKVSGFAQYVRFNRICSHGSLLYDGNLEMLTRILQVDDEKIRSKALKSVRSRVTNVKEYMDSPLPIREFWDKLKENLFEAHDIREYTLTEKDLEGVRAIYEKRYGSPDWTLHRSPRFSLHNGKRFAGGRVDVYLDVREGYVAACSLRGDFLGLLPIRELEERLEKLPFTHKDFEAVLDGVQLDSYLGFITRDELLSCIFE